MSKRIAMDLIQDYVMAGLAPANVAPDCEELDAANDRFVELLTPAYQAAAAAVGVELVITGDARVVDDLDRAWDDREALAAAYEAVHDAADVNVEAMARRAVSEVTAPHLVVTVTEYDVSCLPVDHPEHHNFTIHVSWRGPDSWAVANGVRCLSSTGEWDYEPSPSNREDEYLATHRFDLDTALALAKEQAPLITANHWTVEAVLAQEWT